MKIDKNVPLIAGLALCVVVLASRALAANESGTQSGARKSNIVLVLMDTANFRTDDFRFTMDSELDGQHALRKKI